MTRVSLRSMLLASAVAVFAAPSVAFAQHEHEHAGLAEGKVGEISFPISCTPAAQQQFNRSVAILHSFWYEEAVKSFTAVAETDPNCAMAWWGVAMSVWYPLWYPPSEASLKTGASAVDKAQALGAKTDRERDYIAAIGAFFQDWDKRDHRTRSLAYEKAMDQVYERYPDDNEAAVFYALALIATAEPTDKTYVNVRKADAILEKVLAEEPDHPGVTHYIIHANDYPALAAHGLAAARSYAKIAPAVPHALHMPSHIFTRLGLWQEDVDSNLASMKVGQDYAMKSFGPGVVWDQSLHAMDYLEYAYLQGAQDRDAKRVVDELLAYRKATPENLAAAYAIAAIPARYAVERRDWTEAAALPTPSMALAWERFPWAQAITSFTRALGAAHTGDIAMAKAELGKLDSYHDALVQAKSAYWAGQVEVQRRTAAAAIADAQGGSEEALSLMRSAADLESSTEKHPVTPAPIALARELLGDMMLAMNQPALALAEYQTTLRTDPNRYRSVAGAAEAAQQAGDAAGAKQYYSQLLQICAAADGDRPEIAAARKALAAN